MLLLAPAHTKRLPSGDRSMSRTPAGTVIMWKVVASSGFANHTRPPLPPAARIEKPSGWNAQPQTVPWNASFGFSTVGLPSFQLNTTAAGLPTPAKAFDTFVMPAQPSFEPSGENRMAR